MYGLTTLHASLRAFYAEPLSDATTQEVKLASYAFGLIALGKFILRLPAEILEDELPRLKTTLTSVRLSIYPIIEIFDLICQSGFERVVFIGSTRICSDMHHCRTARLA